MGYSKILAIGLSMLIFMACETTKQLETKTDSPKSNIVISTNSNDEKKDLEKLFWLRRDSTKLNFTEADVEFMSGMIGHHAQALIMSSLAKPNNASKSVQTLAARIINAQKDEIAIMQRWLSDRNQTVPQVRIEGLHLILTPGDEPLLIFSEQEVVHALHGHEKHNQSEHKIEVEESHHMHEHIQEYVKEEISQSSHMGHMAHNGAKVEHNHHTMHHEVAMHDHSDMPGMLTQTQLQELARAKENDFDHLFLRYMIQHHSGAITMVNNLVKVDGAAQEVGIGKLAGDINVDQKTEIERMRLMLMQLMQAEN